MTNRRQFIQTSAAAAALGLGVMPAFAQQPLPELLRIIVGFPPGGTTDAFARRVGEKLRGVYANNVIIDNKPGAGGQLGVMTLKNAPTDGMTMLYTPASMLTIYPHSYSKLGYKQDDVTPISIGHSTDHAFAVGPAVPETVTTVKQFVEWASHRGHPDYQCALPRFGPWRAPGTGRPDCRHVLAPGRLDSAH
jgi:tripartite-type tricarboxylate transporter receptor subunit TctC